METLDTFENFIKLALIVCAFGIALFRIFKNGFERSRLMLIFFTACVMLAEAYWVVNSLLMNTDRFDLLSAEDLGFFGALLYAIVLLQLFGTHITRKRYIVMSALFGLANYAIYNAYTGRYIADAISCALMSSCMAYILQAIHDHGTMSPYVRTILKLSAAIFCILNGALFFCDGTLYDVLEMITYVIWIAVLSYFTVRCAYALKNRKAITLPLAVTCFLFSTYSAFLSDGVFFYLADLMEGVSVLLMVEAVYMEVKADDLC